MRKARYRPRKEIKMWLYRDKDDENRLIDFVQYCKQTRQFARMLRNGIRLMWSLGEGDLTVLFELFPWIAERLQPASNAPDTGNLEKQIADLKNIILQQGGISAPPSDYPVMKSALRGLKKMSLPLLDEDDGQDTIVLKKSTKNNMDNFRASLAEIGLGF